MDQQLVYDFIWILIAVIGVCSFFAGFLVCSIRHELKRKAALK